MPRKNNSVKMKKQEHVFESFTKSMLSDVEKILGVNSLFDGEITHSSFDCPKNLREAFKQECKANGVSVCKMLQNYQLAYIVVSRLKKHAYGNTLSKLVDIPLIIQNLNCNQYVQSRVRRYIKTTEVYEDKLNTGFCSFPNCQNKAVVKAIYLEDNREYEICSLHRTCLSDPKLWKVLKSSG